MPLLTQYQSFFVSPFGEPSACDELNRFVKSHRIVNIEKRLVDGERGTGWIFLIEYGDAGKGSNTGTTPKVDYRAELPADQYACYERLRQLRKQLADQEGIPVYTVFTNEQLAAMVKKPASSIKDIAAIPGVGEARVKQFAEPFLALVRDLLGTDGEATEQPV